MKNFFKKYGLKILIGIIIFIILITLIYQLFSIFNFEDTTTSNENEETIAYKIEYTSSSGKILEFSSISGVPGSKQEIKPIEQEGYLTPEAQTISLGDDEIITFVYTPIEYAITYNLDGGKATNPSEYTIESDNFTLNNPTRIGYDFIGWTSDDVTFPVIDVTIMTGSYGNKTYTAKWDKKKYTLTYDANDGIVDPSSKIVSYQEPYGELPTPTRTGYTFKGWFTDPVAGTQVDSQTLMGTENVTIYAHWEVNTYSYAIKYVSSTGTLLGESEVSGKYSTSIEINAPEKVGYNTPSKQTINFDASTKTITFIYEIINYSITYDLNDGSVEGNQSFYNVETPTFTLNNPTRVGYDFIGWTSDDIISPTTDVTIMTGSYGNKTYTAKWDKKKYTLTYDANDGIVDPSSKIVSYQEPYGELPTPTRTGYTFKGWFTDPVAGTQVDSQTLMGTENVTIYAHWEVNTYSYAIKYVSSTGTLLGESEVSGKYSTSIEINAPEKVGYNTPSKQTVNFDASTKTITFIYEIINYSITYNLNGGSVEGNQSFYNIETPTFTLNNPTRVGYDFIGWTSDDVTSPITDVTIETGSFGNKVYTANWIGKTYIYDIIYKSESGKILGEATKTGVFNTTVKVEPIEMDGYSKPNSIDVVWDSIIPKTITFVYTPIEYTITYNLDGGTATNPSEYTIESDNFTLNNPTRIGYDFIGWTSDDVTFPVIDVTIMTGSYGNKTYTAKWDKKKYTLTYDANDGIVDPSSKIVSYQEPYGELPTPTRTGYTFKGWFTDPVAGTQVDSQTLMGTENVTIYAHWEVNTYSYAIKYVSSTGTLLGESEVSGKYSTSIEINAPEKVGYNTPSKQTVNFDASTKTITFIYEIINYSITYNLNGGSVEGNQSFYNIETPTFTLNNPTKDNDEFTGWSGSNGEEPQMKVSITTGSTGNKEYIANWRGPLESTWFTNIPEGNWTLKSTKNGDVFPGFSDKVIPLTADFSNSFSDYSVNCTSGNMSNSRSASVNGKTVFYFYGHMKFDIARSQAWLDGNGYAKGVFLPFYYNFDLTATQAGVKSGTITTWLEIGDETSDWFINLPDGEWQLKSTAQGDAFPGFSDNVIPLTIDYSNSYSGYSVNNTGGSMSDSRSASINGQTVFYFYGHMKFDIARSQTWLDGNGYAKTIFIPMYYGFDLTSTQSGIKSGTITAWLQK